MNMSNAELIRIECIHSKAIIVKLTLLTERRSVVDKNISLKATIHLTETELHFEQK